LLWLSTSYVLTTVLCTLMINNFVNFSLPEPRVYYHPVAEGLFFLLPPREHSRVVDICFSWLLNFQGSPRGDCRHDPRTGFKQQNFAFDNKIGPNKEEEYCKFYIFLFRFSTARTKHFISSNKTKREKYTSFTRLFAKLHRPGDSEVTFSVFESSCHLLLPVLTSQR